jgi:hypothetical protein
LCPDLFSGIEEILAGNREVLLGETVLNIGDECTLEDGSYKVKAIAQSLSRKDKVRILKNSLTIYLY